jgi:hypothetical protein
VLVLRSLIELRARLTRESVGPTSRSMSKFSIGVAAMGLILGACRDQETFIERRDPIMLMEMFPSYATEHEISALLSGRPLQTVKRSMPKQGGSRPP